jgi:O-antigen/teichoic acid export membrane protein
MEINERSLFSAFLSILGASVGDLIISVLFTPLLVRVLGAGQYGDYAFVLSVLGLLMIFANSGVTVGAKKYLPEKNRPESWQSDVFGFYMRVSLLLVTLVSLPILVLSFFNFFGFVEERFVLYFQLMIVILLFKQVYWFTKNALQGMGYERYSEPIRILQKVSFACLALGLAYLGYGIPGVLTGYVLSLALAILGTTVYLSKIVDFRSIVRRHAALPRRQLLTFNLVNVLLMFLMASLYNVDIILLRMFAGETPTGYYKAALVVAQLMLLLPSTLQSLLLHSSSNYWSGDEREKITTVGTLATRITLVTSLLMAAGLVVLADEFMPFYFGSDFTAAVSPVVLLLPGVVGLAMARPISAIIKGSGQLRVLVYATGGAATINMVLNLLLIPFYGMVGAAVATSVGYGSMAVFSTLAARHAGFDPAADLRLFRICVSAFVATAVMYSVDLYVTNPFVGLALIPVIGTVVYLAVIFQTGAITEQETRRITERLPDPVASRADQFLSLIT